MLLDMNNREFSGLKVSRIEYPVPGLWHDRGRHSKHGGLCMPKPFIANGSGLKLIVFPYL